MPLDLSGLVPVVEELLLQDTIRISTASGGARVFNPATGEYEYEQPDVVYEGIGAIISAYTNDVAASTPDSVLPWVSETRSRYRLMTPLAAPVARKDMIVEVVAVHAGGDLSLLERKWRVQDPAVAGTLGVVRTTMLDQITQPREA
ncbi:DUF6093 family protein [Streptomyces sp. NPDC021056]|uniref:DUF6093 family protein n=1 Tax=Streptomyces sp. NPDC021056 TaxID=3155012 RepID=UPI0033DC0365